MSNKFIVISNIYTISSCTVYNVTRCTLYTVYSTLWSVLYEMTLHYAGLWENRQIDLSLHDYVQDYDYCDYNDIINIIIMIDTGSSSSSISSSSGSSSSSSSSSSIILVNTPQS